MNSWEESEKNCESLVELILKGLNTFVLDKDKVKIDFITKTIIINDFLHS